jgi:hypothetical protein
MKTSVLKSIMVAGAMMVASCLTANAAPAKASLIQESRDSLKKGKTDTMKKGRKMKKDTTGRRMKSDTVAKMK